MTRTAIATPDPEEPKWQKNMSVSTVGGGSSVSWTTFCTLMGSVSASSATGTTAYLARRTDWTTSWSRNR
jgi:hypothetical protein